jgi:hypothetical protein
VNRDTQEHERVDQRDQSSFAIIENPEVVHIGWIQSRRSAEK